MIAKLILSLLISFTLTRGDDRGPRVKRIVGGEPALEPPADDPTVFTNFASKAARIHGVRNFPHYVFKGIKYAHAPVGKDRFLRPREKLLQGVINATAYAPPCIQPRPSTNEVIGSEDCLALNIFTPELPTGTEGLPVVVWIHGGGFRYGSASQYGVRHLVGKRLVVVTIQYRLGSLGFLSSGTKQLPGNVALWDMVLAVQWVRNYIGFFGGNPYKIVVMGHGTGASSALMVSLSNVAKGLTSGVVAMSGTAVSNWATDNTPQHTAKDVAVQNGCPTADAVVMVKCLQTLPPASIIRGDSNVEFSRIQSNGFMGGLSGGLGSAPVTEGINDGRSLPGLVQEDAIDELDKGSNPKIPLLTGICKDETKRFIKGPMKDNVVQKIQNTPNYLENDLIQKLRKGIPLKVNIDFKKIKEDFEKGISNIENYLGKFVPPNFSNYAKVTNGSIPNFLEKIADVTNDALFNVPAFLTVDKWGSNGAPTYLYSFEHVGKNHKGHTFLRGSPLYMNYTHFEDSNDTVAHGDDLSYLFDAYDIEGNPLNETHTITDEDIEVREIFSQMIADFARYGAPRVNNKTVSPFSSAKNNFIQITPKPKLADNFKFCEMAIWCNIFDRLRSNTCDFLKAVDVSFQNMRNFAQGLLAQKNVTATDIFKEFNKLKNLSDSGINIFNQSRLNNLDPDKVFKEIKNWKVNFDNGINNQTNKMKEVFKPIEDLLNKTKNQNRNIFGNKQENKQVIDLFGNKQNNDKNKQVIDLFGNKQENKQNLDLLENKNKQNIDLFGIGNKQGADLFGTGNKQNIDLFGNGNKPEYKQGINLFGNTNKQEPNWKNTNIFGNANKPERKSQGLNLFQSNFGEI